MAQTRATRTVLSSEAKAKLAQLVDDVYARGTHYIIRRFDTPRAVLIPLEDYQRLLSLDAVADTRAVRESGPAYNVGEEHTPAEIAALLDSLLGPRDE
jgi:prevent-host-death family protein